MPTPLTDFKRPRGRPKTCNCNICPRCKERLRKANYRKKKYDELEQEYLDHIKQKGD